MRNTFLSRALVFLVICASFGGCQHSNSAAKQPFNTYLPPTFESYFENVEFTETPLSPNANNTWNTSDVDVSYVDSTRKLIAFTFDDAPSKTLENVCAVFAEYNSLHPDCMASATVFVNSIYVNDNSLHQLHTAHILDMELGNHTHSHYDLTTLDEQALQAEIDRTDQALFQVDGRERHLLRAPFGKVNEQVKALAKTPIIDWTIDTLDWTRVDADTIYNSVMSQKFSGAIVLMHDGYEETVAALKRLLPDLKNEGYQVVSVSALAKAHGCVLQNGGVYIRARKQ